MRLLFIHADALEFEAKKAALKGISELPEDRRRGAAKDTLVLFYSIEQGDDADVPGLVAQAVAQVQDVAKQVKAPHVTLYPYAHLSSQLAPPRVAQEVGKNLVAAVQAAGFEVLDVPFGYYKGFQLKAKGHPLAELSRTLKPGVEGPVKGAAASSAAAPAQAGAPAGAATGGVRPEVESEALKAEKKLVSTWHVLTPEGELVAAESFDFGPWPDLKRLYDYEHAKVRASKEEPPHVKSMRALELVDYEPGSDQGNFRWYPKGSMVKRLLEQHVSDIVARHGALRVETPIMYDYAHPALSKYLQRFPARQYRVQSDEKEFFLRFAACFGQYLIAHDATFSYKHLPVKLYELTHYSFRREQSGEVAGLKRLRAFTMPDMHTIVADMDQAKDEFAAQFGLCMGWMEDIDVPYEAAIRFVRSFYEENKEFATALARKLGRPMLLEMWDERFFYFVMKFEFNVLDTQNKASALSTVQIDVENTERFDIRYTDAQGKKQHPYLLHTSVSGSVDRNVYGLLEHQAARAQQGHKSMLPFWLSPTQVRICPVSESYLAAAEQLAQDVAKSGARVDVDDREEGVGRKIRDAEKEWVPLIVVVGEKEAASGRYATRIRWTGEQQELPIEALTQLIRDQQGDRPTAPLPLPGRLSKRPIFRG